MPTTDVKIRHVYSPEFRTALIDNSLVTSLSDLISDRIVISLTRMENRSVSELARKEDNGAITILPGITPETEFIKIVEFAAEMRPDQIFGLVGAIGLLLLGYRQSVGSSTEFLRNSFPVSHELRFCFHFCRDYPADLALHGDCGTTPAIEFFNCRTSRRNIRYFGVFADR